MNKDKKKLVLQVMHKYGKLTSCNSDAPEKVDELFVQEVNDIYMNQRSLF